MKQLKSQEIVLKDISNTGKERPWRTKKLANELLAMAYDEVDIKKAERLRQCATELAYAIDPVTGIKRLKSANFCRIRLCPICQWRRSLKTFIHMTKIYQAVESDRKHGYVFLTLTMENMPLEQLNEGLNQLFSALNRFFGYARIKRAVKGWYRGVEITHNVAMGTFHPHVHCLLCVNKRYFKSSDYISQQEWGQLWKRALQVDYNPVIDVRKVKNDVYNAVVECAKYSVKESSLIYPDDWELTVTLVAALDKILNKRRFIAYGGIFKFWHQKLNLDDEESGDLIHIEDDKQDISELDPIIVYTWRTGYSQYIVDVNR